MAENKHFDFFFSYKSDSVGFVRRVAERLLGEGRTVWMDEYNIHHDQQDIFQLLIIQGIDRSVWGVLFVDDPYAYSVYCLIEAERLLRQIPIEHIVVLLLTDSNYFNKLYPELYMQGVRTDYNEFNIYKVLAERGAISDNITPRAIVEESDKYIWHVREAGFAFDNSLWEVNTASRFYGLTNRQKLDFSG